MADKVEIEAQSIERVMIVARGRPRPLITGKWGPLLIARFTPGDLGDSV